MGQRSDFKGWYFKCSTQTQTIAFIPSCHRVQDKRLAFLQIITDSAAFQIPCHTMSDWEQPLFVHTDHGVFSESGIRLHLQTKALSANGVLRFRQLSPLSYDIMGPFRFVPFMQCRHSVCSMRHRIDGKLRINETVYRFCDGVGYIEGDRGCSFPKRYLWTQCFFENGSVMLSVADIPMLGRSFTGIIGVWMQDGKEHRMATYLGARVKEIGKNFVSVTQGEWELTARLLAQNPHPLLAPQQGAMSRIIHESAACKAYYRLSHQGKILCEFTSEQASFEFEYP